MSATDWQICAGHAGTLLTRLRGLNLHYGARGRSDSSPRVCHGPRVDNYHGREVDRFGVHAASMQLPGTAGLLLGAGLYHGGPCILERLIMVESKLQLYAPTNVLERRARERCAHVERVSLGWAWMHACATLRIHACA